MPSDPDRVGLQAKLSRCTARLARLARVVLHRALAPSSSRAPALSRSSIDQLLVARGLVGHDLPRSILASTLETACNCWSTPASYRSGTRSGSFGRAALGGGTLAHDLRCPVFQPEVVGLLHHLPTDWAT
eukprot:7695866-Pyramimonas_sp.AAC.1